MNKEELRLSLFTHQIISIGRFEISLGLEVGRREGENVMMTM